MTEKGKNTTACILMKVLKIVDHSHPNYTVGLFQVVLRKTNGWEHVGLSMLTLPRKCLMALTSEERRPSSLLVSTTSGNLTFLTSSYWHSSITLHLCSAPVYLFRHLKMSIVTALTLLSAYRLGFSQLISLRSEDASVKWSITRPKTVSARI